jgi:putative ABC transport system permease protein
MIRILFKTPWRTFTKNKGIGILNIGGLAVGMTAAVLIFLWVQNEMTYDNFQKDNGRIYRLTTMTTDKNWIWEGSPMLFADAVKKEMPDVEQITRLYADNSPVLNINGISFQQKQCAYVDPSWFSLFQYHFTEGNASAFSQNIFSIILSASEAKKYFGTQPAMGKLIQIDGAAYQVNGVVQDPPTNSSFQYHAFIPINALLTNKERKENGESWDNTDYLTFIKLRPGVQTAGISKSLTSILQKYSHDDKNSIAAAVVSLKDMHFENNLQGSEFEHGNKSVVYIFSMLGILILLVACINYVNLTTAKASLRAKEVSVRKIVGAGRGDLFTQFISESLLISLLSLAVTLVLIYLLLPGFNSITGKTFMFDIGSPDLWKVLGSATGIAILLNSIYPALLLSSFKPLNMFRGITILKLKDTNFRKGLVVIQFSVSILLITGTLVIYRQMHFIQNRELGYDRSQVLAVGLPFNQQYDNKEQFMRTMQQQLAAGSSIENVSMVNQPIVRISSATTGGDWDGHDTSVNPKLAQLSADAGVQQTMHLKMAAGRWFDPSDIADRNNFILNETAVRELKIHQPVIGQRFKLHGKTGMIVGIAKDFHFKSMHEKVGPLVIFNNPEWWNYFLVRTTTGNAANAIQSVEKVWKQFAPGIPLEYSFLDERFNDLYRQDQLASVLILSFAIIAVIISAMGLFGLAAFAAEQRTKEVGIRKILGASMASIGVLLSKDFVKLVIIAFVIAAPLSWFAMNSWLENFAYRINMSWWIIGLAGIAALLIALMITNYHAIRAGLRNPAVSLRTE